MDLYSPTNNNLDNHHCPQCNWSFLNRLPRTLDCNHSFYFCENCLKRRDKVQCGICRKMTIIQQILSPRNSSTKSTKSDKSITFSFSSEDISQFATLPTQILLKQSNNHQYDSSHKICTWPLKQYKHYQYGSSSEPIKHSNINNTQTNECKKCNDQNEEINTLRQICYDQDKEINELKKKNIKLTQQLIQNNDLRNKLKILSNDIKKYKESLIDDTFKPLIQNMNNEMNEMLNISKKVLMDYNKEMILRRKYFNKIQELKGNIRVYCRIRPLLTNEIQNNFTMKVNKINNFQVNIEKNAKNNRDKDYKKTFEYDHVFGIKSTENEIFNEGIKDLIESALDGYNICIFAYGQTGSGKTYTMNGINYKTIHQLFNIINNERKLNYKYTLKLTMLEIYNEKIKDLLVTKKSTKSLKIMDDDKTGINITNLSELDCNTINDVYKALDIGYKKRSFGITDLNSHSSRSHCILTINVEGINLISNMKYISKLHLIDLAGSERVKISNATGNTMKEAQSINKSLSCLGNVLQAIKLKNQYIPYRDSKLTHLLKDSIGNGAKTLMFVTVSSCSKDVNQSLISLLFADRVRNVCLGKSTQNQFKISDKSKKRRISLPNLTVY